MITSQGQATGKSEHDSARPSTLSEPLPIYYCFEGKRRFGALALAKGVLSIILIDMIITVTFYMNGRRGFVPAG